MVTLTVSVFSAECATSTTSEVVKLASDPTSYREPLGIVLPAPHPSSLSQRPGEGGRTVGPALCTQITPPGSTVEFLGQNPSCPKRHHGKL